MLRPSSSSVEVRFLDRDKVLEDLRRAAKKAKSQYPEIVRVLLFGSLVEGNWTADSDAGLIAVARRDFPDLLERSRYQIHCSSIPTDTLVYSETEFERLVGDPGSFLHRALACAQEL